MPGMVEMSRINVVPIEMNLNRGQQVRSKCCLYRAGAAELPPLRLYTRTDAERAEQRHDTIKGATVVDPKPDLYTMPVVTLDQAALYPATMVTHNLCFTSYVADDYALTEDPHVMQDPDPVRNLTLAERERRAAAAVYTVCDVTTELPFAEAPYEQPAFPDGPRRAPRFLRHSVRLGIAPKVQTMLLAHRKRTKTEMAAAYKAGEAAKGDLLHQRQLAIKMLANSLYGTLAAPTASSYAPIVSATVTRRGRALLMLARSIVMLEFAQHGVDVIYGDTVGGGVRASTRLTRPAGFNLCLAGARRVDRRGGQDRARDGGARDAAHEGAVHDRHAAVQYLLARV
jgi:DNA polymerase elongation subunit (family B)